MSEAAAFRGSLFLTGAAHFKGNQLKQIGAERQCNILRKKRKLRLLKIESQVASPSTYSSRILTGIPLYEIPGASFDQYLEDKPRVFTAIFPEKQRSQQLNEAWTKNQTERPITDEHKLCSPPVLGLVPEKILRDVAESFLKRLVENMKKKVNGSLMRL